MAASQNEEKRQSKLRDFSQLIITLLKDQQWPDSQVSQITTKERSAMFATELGILPEIAGMDIESKRLMEIFLTKRVHGIQCWKYIYANVIRYMQDVELAFHNISFSFLGTAIVNTCMHDIYVASYFSPLV